MSRLLVVTALSRARSAIHFTSRGYSGGSRNTTKKHDRTPQSFADMHLDARLLAEISTLYNIKEPTALQRRLMPHLMSPRNHVVVVEATGTGKTFTMLLAMLSATVAEYKALAGEKKPLEYLKMTSLFVVPNRELALQIEQWAKQILKEAYPELGGMVQSFVSGEPYQAQQLKVLKRHGPPAIAVGTPRRLLELLSDESAELKIEPPALLRAISEQPQSSHDSVLSQLRVRAQWRATGAKDFVGLRRLYIDEVDNLVKIPGKHSTEKQRKLRLAKPRPGQVLVDTVFEMFGLTALARAQQPKRLASTPSRQHKTGWHKDDMAVSKQFGAAMGAAERGIEAVEIDRDMGKGIVGARTLQVVASSATASRALRSWMGRRGWVGPRPVWVTSEAQRTPPQIKHFCLVVENEHKIRNLQIKDKSPEAALARYREALDTKAAWVPGATPWDSGVEVRSEQQQQTVMEIMAEAASNVIREMQPAGTVVIFTRADASTTQFGHVLESYGVRARDIMMRFGDSAVSGDSGPAVFLATEEAARGLDIPDASLVLILDVPKTVGSYLHMAGRTGRCGRAGSVVTVVPVGRLGYYESKMRGIYGALGVQPLRAPFVED